MIPDFTNLSLEKCKELVLGYQKTKDPNIFNLLLARFDKYLIYLIYNYNKYVTFLKGEVPQDLYHTSIIGFSKAITVFKEDLPARMLVLRIGSYVVSELKQTYSYKIKEILFDEGELNNGIDNFTSPSYEYNKEINNISVNLILSSPILNDCERELLKMKYYEGFTYHEICVKTKLCYSVVFKRVQTALKKIRKENV